MMPAFLHLDEARAAALDTLETMLAKEPKKTRAVLVDDLFGELRLALWPAPGADSEELRKRISAQLERCAGTAWSGVTWVGLEDASTADKIVLDSAWNEGVEVTEQLRVLDRVRNRTAWFEPPRDPPWRLPADAGDGEVGPPIVAFCSFKGGVGRTTALAGFALARARVGERVVVIDLDLDAPGVGTLLAPADERSRWGVVDYLLERARGEVPLEDYLHVVSTDLAGAGTIEVMSAGTVDGNYVAKLARLDLEVSAQGSTHPLGLLFEDLHRVRRPDWILVDTRAGLSSAAGLILGGVAHLYVVFATSNAQSEAGLTRFAERLGADRLRCDPAKAQAPLIVVHAMVPEDLRTAKLAESDFAARLESILTDHYFDRTDAESDDRFWSVDDLDTTDGPHNPVPIPYSAALATFTSLVDAAPVLVDGPAYKMLAARIDSLLPRMPRAADEGVVP